MVGGLECRGARTNPDKAGPRQSLAGILVGGVSLQALSSLGRCGSGLWEKQQQGNRLLYVRGNCGRMVSSGWLRVMGYICDNSASEMGTWPLDLCSKVYMKVEKTQCSSCFEGTSQCPAPLKVKMQYWRLFWKQREGNVASRS